MQWVLLAVGLVIGGGAGAGITFKVLDKKTPPPPLVIKDNTAEKQQDVILQVTDLDLVKEICSAKFIVEDNQSPILCREMFCRMQQRGIDAKTGSSECEQISNVANKVAIHDFCRKSATTKESDKSIIDNDKLKQCIEFFDRRI